MQAAQIFPNRLCRFRRGVDQDCFGRAAAQCLDGHVARAGEEVQNFDAGKIMGQDVEQRFLDPRRRRSKRSSFGGFEASTARAATDDAHVFSTLRLDPRPWPGAPAQDSSPQAYWKVPRAYPWGSTTILITMRRLCGQRFHSSICKTILPNCWPSSTNRRWAA